MAKRVSAEPRVRMIEAIQAEYWTVAKAVSEFVDNALGELRGNATEVRIIWDSAHHKLTILDNGRGMANLVDIFRLGQTIGSGGSDIGRWGMGGSKALVWLASEVEVWTLHNGRAARIAENWHDFQRRDTGWEFEQDEWRATPQNTPADLYDLRHGTMICLRVDTKRRKITPNQVQRELTRVYAPALRAGRRIIWENQGRSSRERIELASSLVVPGDAADVVLEAEFDGNIYRARLGYWRQSESRISESGITVGYGHRVVLPYWRDCFSGMHEGVAEEYAGPGVMGFLDLGHEWLNYLSLDKSEFNHQGVRDALQQALFTLLRDLLIEAQEEAEQVQLEHLAAALSEGLGGVFDVEVPVKAERLRPELSYRWSKGDTGAEVPAIEIKRTPEFDSQSGSGAEQILEKRKASATVLIQFVSASRLPYRGLYDVGVVGDQITVYLNKDHEDVKHARDRATPTKERMLYALIVPAIRTKLLEEPSLRHLLTRSVRERLDEFETQFERASFLDSLLLSGARVAA